MDIEPAGPQVTVREVRTIVVYDLFHLLFLFDSSLTVATRF